MRKKPPVDYLSKEYYDDYPDEYYEYHSIEEYPVVLDFSAVRYYDDFFELIKKKFGLPQYCGCNLDALWDCMSYMWSKDETPSVELHGVFSFREDMQEELDGFLHILREIQEITPGLTISIKS